TPADRGAPWLFADRPSLEVVVVDEEGSPVPGAWVTLSPGGRDARADADGVATFHAIDPGRRDVVAAASGSGTTTAPVLVGENGGSVSLILASSPRTVALIGAVTDPYGAPVGGVGVRVDGDLLTHSEADGSYHLELPAG